MKPSLFLVLTFTVIFNACSPKLRSVIVEKRQPLAYDSEVFVLNPQDPIPADAKVIGNLSIGDTGFTTKCTYEMVLEQARLQARENGANVVRIVEHKRPNALGSSCHRLKVVFYSVVDTSDLANNYEEPVLADVDYALLYVYRYSGTGSFVGYDLHLGDSTLLRVKNSFKDVIRIKKEGLNMLWSKTESKAEVPVDIVYGKSYYLRCGIKMGAFVGRPTLELVDYRTGKAEYDSFDSKNTSEE